MKLVNKIISVDGNARQEPVFESSDVADVSSTLSQIIGDDQDQGNQPSIPDYSLDPEHNDTLRSTIEVSVDLLSRLYSGLYILQQAVSTIPWGEERAPMAKELIQTRLINPLAKTFPDMNDFEFDVVFNDSGNMIVQGKNMFSATLLQAIRASLLSPTAIRQESPYDSDDIE